MFVCQFYYSDYKHVSLYKNIPRLSKRRTFGTVQTWHFLPMMPKMSLDKTSSLYFLFSIHEAKFSFEIFEANKRRIGFTRASPESTSLSNISLQNGFAAIKINIWLLCNSLAPNTKVYKHDKSIDCI